MPIEDARALIKQWATMYPQAWKYLQDCANLVKQGKSIRSPMGRYKRPGLVTPENIAGLQNEYKNYTIQSTVAEFTLLAAIKLQKLLNPVECKIVNEVHDSLVFTMKDDNEIIKRNSNLIVDVMQNIPKEYLGWKLPFYCDVEVGYNWADIYEIDTFIEHRSLLQKGQYTQVNNIIKGGR